MCPQKGRNHIHGMPGIKFTHHLQLLQLGFQVQAVAAFAFHRRDPETQHGIQPLFSGCGQRFPAGSARGRHRTVDTAAPGHDFHIGVACQAPGKLVGTVAPEDEVGVGIHKPGQDRFAGAIDDGKIIPVDRAG